MNCPMPYEIKSGFENILKSPLIKQEGDLVLAGASFSWMERLPAHRSSRFCSYEKLVAIGLALVAVFSPLYIDRRADIDAEIDEGPFNWLLLQPLVLILAITLMLLLDQSLTRFDLYWIHRVGGSSAGIIAILVVLALILKCKASMNNGEA